MALDKVDLSRMNENKRLEKRKQNDAANPGFFSGVIARGLRGNAIDKAYDTSKKMNEQYGGDAAKSRGFMAYDKPPTSKTKQKTGTPPSVIASRNKIAAKKNPEDYEPRMSPGMPKSMDEKYRAEGYVTRRKDGGVVKKAKGGKISEYGGKEMYKSKSAMMKHEGSESMAMERKERKMAMGGKCRGMGAATKGGNYKG